MGGFIVVKLYWRIPHSVDAVWVDRSEGGERQTGRGERQTGAINRNVMVDCTH